MIACLFYFLIGFTPLMLCVSKDQFEMAEILLKYGGDPNIKDQKSGRTALFHAVESNNGM